MGLVITALMLSINGQFLSNKMRLPRCLLASLLLITVVALLIDQPKDVNSARISDIQPAIPMLECPDPQPPILSEAVQVELTYGAVFYEPLCSPGLISIEMRGTGHPYVVLSTGLNALWEGRVSQQRLDIEIEQAGWLALAFLNAAPEDTEGRSLWIESAIFVP